MTMHSLYTQISRTFLLSVEPTEKLFSMPLKGIATIRTWTRGSNRNLFYNENRMRFQSTITASCPISPPA